ncbi:MAG: DNA-binding beta-propeller fold protein YncE [Flavobacteriales bacterium]|jgi:DNA-binding beta-propeller fold protein YncE
MRKMKYTLLFFACLFQLGMATAQEEVLISNLALPFNVTVGGSYVYFDEDDNGQISRVDLSDLSKGDEFVVEQFSRGMTTKGDFLYNFAGGIYKIDLSNEQFGSHQVLATGFMTAPVIAGGFMYYAHENNLFKLDLTTSTFDTTRVYENLVDASYLAFYNEEIYVMSRGGVNSLGSIYKINLNSDSLHKQTLISNLQYPEGITIDENGMLYYSEEKNIMHANLLDSIFDPEVFYYKEFADIRGLHHNSGYIYFTSGGDGDGQVSRIQLNTQINEQQLTKSLLVYPNPVSQYIQINNFNHEPYRIYDIVGKIVNDGVLNEGLEINVEELPDGVYFLNIDGLTAKFIKN